MGYWELVVVLLLLDVRVQGQNAEEVLQLCQSKEVPFPLDGSASDPVVVEGCIGTRLSLVDLPADSVCSLDNGVVEVVTLDRSPPKVLLHLTGNTAGICTVKCTWGNGSHAALTLNLTILKRPSPPSFDFIKKGDHRSPEIKCVSDSNPKATVMWYTSLQASGKEYSENPIKTSEDAFVNKKLMCCAANAIGTECTQLYDYDMDSESPVGVEQQEVKEVVLSPGQSLLLRCTSKDEAPQWFSKGRGPEITTQSDKHGGFQMAYLYFRSLTLEQTGTYTCRPKNKTISVQVLAESLPSVSLAPTNKTISAKEAMNFCLQATISSHPLPDYCAWESPDGRWRDCGGPSWRNRTRQLCDHMRSGEYKLHLEVDRRRYPHKMKLCVADKPQFNCQWLPNILWCETVSPVPTNVSWRSCQEPNDSNCTIFQQEKVEEVLFCETRINRSLMIDKVPPNHFAQFCLTNAFGSWCSDAKYRTLPSPIAELIGHENPGSELKIGILVLLVALILIGMLFLYNIRKKPRYESQLQMIQIMGPNDNDYIYINFKDFQYDQKWEFPRENLQLGKELGSGAFGMVVQATAVGFGPQGNSQVAVKMLKEKHQTVEKEALMSELKMMTQIGNHDNIVNLLGACTGTGPVYLIFQFCWYGDLLNYLKNNRECYHKSLTDAFNKDRFTSLYHNLQSNGDSSEFQIPVENYVHMHPTTTGGQENLALLNLTDDGMDKGSGQQAEELEGLTYNDLLSFAHQVAMGMEFLSAKNCIHRDLAARNVLVTKDRLVKIGDFGLARDIDHDSNYVVRGNVRLPVKWMAPESIFQGMYTMKSDVWAYGILLWEIFSLGVTPYPGVKVDNKFYSMIERGFQMECPYYAGVSVYRVMCKCWSLEPSVRPAFSKLAAFMEAQLTNMEEKLYHNTAEEGSSDYMNASAIFDSSSPLMKEKAAPGPSSQNDYCQTAE
ncbi:unnamed protein product [Gadus morhua 'NCC']